ncbi:22312_t:CDS:2 [Entrophospora sp. SA101]|nr:22312_t:CDS:2 [Entrophospora sp. SA101]
MLHDISKPHKILTIHAELQINEDHSKNLYYHNVTKRDISTAPLVPLLPGHCFIDAEDEDEFNFFLKWNEHEEFEDSEVTNVNENIDTFASIDIIEISDDIREESSTEESTNQFK